MMTSAAETPSPLWMSVGMPRPSSRTVQEPSGLSVTVTCVGVAGERLVDGVVDDLVDHVVQARAVVGVADIHAGPLAHRIEALEDLDGFRAVIGRRRMAVWRAASAMRRPSNRCCEMYREFASVV